MDEEEDNLAKAAAASEKAAKEANPAAWREPYEKAPEKKFKRIAIEESSEDDEEEAAEQTGVKVTEQPQVKPKDCHANVFFDVNIGGKPSGRITMKLF